MKKIAILLAVLMLLSLAACAKTEQNATANPASTGTNDPGTNGTQTASNETEPVETESGKKDSVETEPVETESGKKDPVETEPVETDPREEQDVTPAALEAAIAAALGDGYLSTQDVPEDELYACALGAVDMDQISAYVAKQALVAAVNPDTVVIVRCKDAAYADEVVDLFNESYAQAIGYTRLYAFGVAKVENARLYKAGDLVLYIIGGADAEMDATGEQELALAEAEYAKIDEAIKSVLGYLPENLIEIPEEDPNAGGFGGLGGFGDFDGGEFVFESGDGEDTPVTGD